MRKLAVAVMFVCLVAAVANAADLRLWFSKQGTTAGIPAEWTGKTTPSVLPGEKVYIWATTEKTGTKFDIWNGLALDVDHAVTAGVSYNPWLAAAELYRWHPDSDLTWLPPNSDGNYGMFGIAVTDAGLGHAGDPLKIDEGTTNRHLLVAEMTFPAALAKYDVYMKVGAEGIARKGGSPATDKVYFGFGDAGLLGSDFGKKSTLPDLHVIPEPASLALIGLAVLALRRR